MHEPVVGFGADLCTIYVGEAIRRWRLRRLHGNRAGSTGHAAGHLPYRMLQFLPGCPTSGGLRVSISATSSSRRTNREKISGKNSLLFFFCRMILTQHHGDHGARWQRGRRRWHFEHRRADRRGVRQRRARHRTVHSVAGPQPEPEAESH